MLPPLRPADGMPDSTARTLTARDRWGNTPLDDAKREGHQHVIDTLQRWFDRS